MHEIITHKINARQPRVFAHDDIGLGGAEQSYLIEVGDERSPVHTVIIFSSIDSPGCTNEALLAILIDRLAGFQEGPFACEQNAEALGCCARALGVLNSRTLARMARSVENTMEP